MKKKILLITLMVALFVCLFAISVNAEQIEGYQQFEVELLDGSVITVYESAYWDKWQGRLNFTDDTYTEPPLDTEKTYPLLDWSQVVVADFTNGCRMQLNSETGEYEVKYGTNDGYSMFLSSVNFTKDNATNLKTIKTGAATLVTGGNFGSFPALEKIICGEKLKDIQWNAFDYNTNLTTIDFSACTNFTTFGQQAFKGCTSLETVTLPNTVTNLSNNVFSGCTSLKTVVLSTSLTTVDSSTFIGCTSLETVSFVGTPSEELKTATSTAAPNATITSMTACEAYGHSNMTSINDCVEQCGVCETFVEKATPNHNVTSVIEYLNGYGNKGEVIHFCKNEGCTYRETAEAVALFTCQGYSYGSSGILMGFTINKNAISEYEKTGKNLSYGLFAGLETKLGTNEAVSTAGIAQNGAISVDFTTRNYDIMEIKVVGFNTNDHKEAKVILGAYVIETNGNEKTVSYLQSGEVAEGKKYVSMSYNDLAPTTNS